VIWILADGAVEDAIGLAVGLTSFFGVARLGLGLLLVDLRLRGNSDLRGLEFTTALVILDLALPLADDALEDRLAHLGRVVGPGGPARRGPRPHLPAAPARGRAVAPGSAPPRAGSRRVRACR